MLLEGMPYILMAVSDAELKQSQLLQTNLKTFKTKLRNSVDVIVLALSY